MPSQIEVPKHQRRVRKVIHARERDQEDINSQVRKAGLVVGPISILQLPQAFSASINETLTTEAGLLRALHAVLG